MKKTEYLKAMDIDVWLPRETHTSQAGSDDWQLLEAQAKACMACGLEKTRTQVVFGSGNKDASILFVGEAPGAQEDQQGKPFVGRAGQLLTNMLKAIELTRDDIYIANILKCRPPNNRDPKAEEVNLCTPFLTRQIALLQPKLIVALGRIAAHFLLDSDTPLGKMRGQVYQYNNIPLIVTYHPAYLLRSPTEKRKAWEDLLRIKTFK